jgi:hypothetical protein
MATRLTSALTSAVVDHVLGPLTGGLGSIHLGLADIGVTPDPVSLDFRRDDKKQVTDALFRAMQPLRKVKQIYLNGCVHVTDEGFRALAAKCQGPEWTHLDLTGCPQITDGGFTALADKCQNVTHFGLSSRNLTDTTLTHFAENKCTNVTYLNLTGCARISEASVTAFAAACGEKLTYLNVAECLHLTDRSIRAFASVCGSNLTYLNLTGCAQITDATVEAFATACGPTLTHLYLTGCIHITNASLAAFAADNNKCTQLTHVGVGDNRNISNQAFIHFAKACCQNATHLALKGCRNLTYTGLHAFAAACGPNLTHLALSDCYFGRLGSDGLQPLETFAKTLTDNSLTWLNLKNCGFIPDAILRVFANKCGSNLTYLNLNHCVEISNETFRAFAAKCGPALLHLDVGTCTYITDENLREVVIRCPHLNSLGLDQMYYVYTQTLRGLPRTCPVLHELDLRGVSHFSHHILYEWKNIPWGKNLLLKHG